MREHGACEQLRKIQVLRAGRRASDEKDGRVTKQKAHDIQCAQPGAGLGSKGTGKLLEDLKEVVSSMVRCVF